MLNPLHPLSRGLVGQWMFNEGAGSRANDISGHGNHGTLKNMAPNTQGSGWGGSKFGGSLQFDGVDDYAVAPTFRFSQSGTLNIRAKMDLSTELATLCQEDASGFFDFDILSGMLRSRMFDTSFKAYNYVITHDVFHDIMVTWDTNKVKWFLDGIEKGSANFTGLNAGATSMVFGADRSYSSNLKCQFDSVRIYNRALAAAEVSQLYHTPFCNLLQVPTRYVAAAGPAGAIMNQFQKFNIGADLYNGGIIA